jgi:hypothetical protein
MPKATNIGTGKLNQIKDCYILIPITGNSGFGNLPLLEGTGLDAVKITFDNLPDISDSKSASYNTEPIIGRSTPLTTYSHSDSRTISITCHFFIPDGNFDKYITYLRALESATYPRILPSSGAPFVPPVVCSIKCGKLLGDQPLCCVLQNYNVKFPTDVVWDETTLLPIKFDVDTSWMVVYSSDELPNQDRIFSSGR